MPSTTCAIAGCGPAGAMLGFLLARAGIDVVVLEKHNDFLRDFRGDTIHPSTLELLDELGLIDEFLKLPYSKVSWVQGQTTSGQTLRISLERLPSKFPFIAFMPQWDFLEFMTRHAMRFPSFTLLRNAEVVDLLARDGRVTGVRYRDAEGEHELTALLTVGADGRAARTREAARLPRVETSPPIDVFWFRLPRKAGEVEAVFGRLGPGLLLVMLDRNEYWQVAFVIAKGSGDDMRARGLDAFRRDIVHVAPELADRVDAITTWDDVKLLTVRVDRLTRWHTDGFLAIGDAAHAMSPVGGIGINVAIQDAVVAANVLWKPLAAGRVTDGDLGEVQRRRERSVKLLQSFQTFVQTRFLAPALRSQRTPSIPWIVRLFLRIPILRDLPPRIIALGINRAHIESPLRDRS
ncbi:MAG TPA: FAD-dependent oxidoreductase [Vicinamibacterales bacterium]|nr:FAD-dependent oxidoreductase [Vicinamibacterales bacterium]